MEVLRLYPPVFGTLKETMKGGIQLGEHFIPEKSAVFVS